jgi:hypothetical protein
MPEIREMIASHPRPAAGDMDETAAAIEALMTCSQVCSSCADACLAESMVGDLVRCIRLNLDCSDVCMATSRLLTRQTEPNWQLVREQLVSCITACQVCGDECERHADMHEHCRFCAEHCRHCAESCDRLLTSLPAGATP